MTTDNHEIADNSDAIGKRFENLFRDWIELYQPRFSHHDTTSTGRLDRVYMNTHAIELTDIDVSANIVCEETARSASDHYLLSVYIGKRSTCNLHPSVPVWVAKHRDFAKHVRAEISAFSALGSADAWQTLAALKDIFLHGFYACQEILYCEDLV